MQNRKAKVRRRTNDELLQALEDSLDTLEDLVAIYDAGKYRIAREIAVACFRVLSDEIKSVERHKRRIKSLFASPNEKNLLPQFLFCATQVRIKKGPKQSDLPHFAITFTGSTEGDPLPSVDLQRAHLTLSQYRDEPAIMEGAAGKSLTIPITTSEHIPFKKRRSISRWHLLDRYRSEVSAHTDSGVSDDLDFALTWEEVFPVVLKAEAGQEWDSNNPSLRSFENTLGHALVRTVAEELIQSRRVLLG